MGDFGPHQTKCASKFSIPFLSLITVGFAPPGGRFDLFERSNGRWMSLGPRLLVFLTELTTSQGWVSCPVQSLRCIEPRPVSFSTIVCKKSKTCVFHLCDILPMLNGHMKHARIDFFEEGTWSKYGILRCDLCPCVADELSQN